MVRRAHVALTVAFVAFGIVDGTWTARLPAVQRHLRLDSGELGVAIFCVSLTATLMLSPAGALASRFGSRGPAALGLVVLAAGLAAVALAPSLGTLVVAACVLGAGLGTLDVSANAHAVAIERKLGRPALSALHGAWSFGLLAGAAIAAGVAAVEIGPRVQFPATSIGVVVLALVVVPRLLPGAEDAAVDSAHFALPRGALALPALLTFCSMFVESATMNWSAVFLAGPAGASAAVAATGVAAFAVAMALARLVGDRLSLRLGVDGLARAGGALVVAGDLLAISTRSPIPALLGFALIGAGAGALVPALFRVAASVPGISSSAGIAAVATAGYCGGVVHGPMIGFVARAVGLSGAVSAIGIAGAVIAVLGPRLASPAAAVARRAAA